MKDLKYYVIRDKSNDTYLCALTSDGNEFTQYWQKALNLSTLEFAKAAMKTEPHIEDYEFIEITMKVVDK